MNRKGAVILWVQGGYVLGMASMVHYSMGKYLAKKYRYAVVSPEYRKAKKPSSLLHLCDRRAPFNEETLTYVRKLDEAGVKARADVLRQHACLGCHVLGKGSGRRSIDL